MFELLGSLQDSPDDCPAEVDCYWARAAIILSIVQTRAQEQMRAQSLSGVAILSDRPLQQALGDDFEEFVHASAQLKPISKRLLKKAIKVLGVRFKQVDKTAQYCSAYFTQRALSGV